MSQTHEGHWPPEESIGIDWESIGKALRESAMDAHEGELPPIRIAYDFLLENPSCFIDQPMLDLINGIIHMGGTLTMEDVRSGNVDWPEELMPQEPDMALIAAYYGATS